MSELRKKRNIDPVLELTAASNALFKTPERGLQKHVLTEELEAREDDELRAPNFQSPGDRFIPKRGSAIARQLFNIPEAVLASPSDISNKNEKEQNCLIFENILEQTLLQLSFDPKSETLKEQPEQSMLSLAGGSNHGSKSAKSNNTPIKKMNEQQLVVKRPKVLTFSDKKDSRKTKETFSGEHLMESKMIQSIRNMRKISKTPYKVLDAPGLLDDFYQVRLFFLYLTGFGFARLVFLFLWANLEHLRLVSNRRDFNRTVWYLVLLVEQRKRQQRSQGLGTARQQLLLRA